MSRPPPDVTLAGIVKDERPYLLEWIAYHRLLGFDRLVLYSNDCSDGTDTLLDRLQGAGLIEHRRWPHIPGRSPQKMANADAIRRCETRWILFLDADEFLYLTEHASITALLGGLDDDVSAVAVNWRLFGSGGQQEQRPEPVIERFTRAAPRDFHLNRHVKTIARAEDVEVAGAHGVILRRGRYTRPCGTDVTLHRNAFMPPDHRVAQVNHYVVKSQAEYLRKLARGNVDLPVDHPNKLKAKSPTFFEDHDRNEEEERAILRHLPAVKAEMARIAEMIASPLASPLKGSATEESGIVPPTALVDRSPSSATEPRIA